VLAVAAYDSLFFAALNARLAAGERARDLATPSLTAVAHVVGGGIWDAVMLMWYLGVTAAADGVIGLACVLVFITLPRARVRSLRFGGAVAVAGAVLGGIAGTVVPR
jgi:hypothetical protein